MYLGCLMLPCVQAGLVRNVLRQVGGDFVGMRILAVGDLIWDVYPDDAYIGGATFNFAAHAAKCGAKVYLMSAVGDDELAGAALNVRRNSIKTDFMQVNGYETGKTIVTLDTGGNPSYNVLRGFRTTT